MLKPFDGQADTSQEGFLSRGADHRFSDEDSFSREMRLHRFLARSGAVESRRKAERCITEGRVKVNGEVQTVLGSKVDPTKDVIELDGKRVVLDIKPAYLILNKPAGYVSTMNDPQGRPTVASLVPVQDYPGLYHVGRLDRQTRGLLLFTTDGELGHALIHPSKHVEKTYLARVAKTPSAERIKRLREGIPLKDSPDAPAKMTAPARVELLESDAESSLLSITIHEGRNRQVRRMCKAIGHECLDLQRITFGPLNLDNLDEGQWRELTAAERNAILLAAQR